MVTAFQTIWISTLTETGVMMLLRLVLQIRTTMVFWELLQLQFQLLIPLDWFQVKEVILTLKIVMITVLTITKRLVAQ